MTLSHPTQTGRLVAFAAGPLAAGIISLLTLANLDLYSSRGAELILTWLTIVSFALFIVVFAVGLFGWMMREHDVWRQLGGPEHLATQARAKGSGVDATGRPAYRYDVNGERRD